MLKRVRKFELELPPAGRSKSLEKTSKALAEVFTTDELIRQPAGFRKELGLSLEDMVLRLFPKMGRQERDKYVSKFFQLPGKTFHRQAILIRDPSGKLAATALFDHGHVEYRGGSFTSVYSILRAVRKEFQGIGLGQSISSRIIMDLQPDILFANTYQSDSLHAWANLVLKDRVTGYDLFPRIEKTDGKEIIVTVPFRKLEFVVRAFQQTYVHMVSGPEFVESELKNLTLFMVRKDNHEAVFDFDAWLKHGKEDRLAKALRATNRDGIMLVFLRKERQGMNGG